MPIGLNMPGKVQIRVAHTDRVGKVFVAMAHGMRKCLVCDGVFTTQGAAEHAGTVCFPSERDSRAVGGSKE